MAKPLHEILKGPDTEALDSMGNLWRAFDQIKTALISVPALGIPDLNRSFTLFTSEKQRLALGVLSQKVDQSHGQWHISQNSGIQWIQGGQTV